MTAKYIRVRWRVRVKALVLAEPLAASSSLHYPKSRVKVEANCSKK